MSGWTRDQAEDAKVAFFEFLDNTWVKSKEKGWIILGQNLYGAQTLVIDRIFDGLANDIHDFKILKSRQLGISTIIRALTCFWAGVFDVTGSLMFDTSQHLAEARQEMVDMMERFPARFEFPRMIGNNRYSVTLANKSRINLVSAGVSESKTSKTLGVGSAVSVSHRSELCNYGNATGMETFRHSLAKKNPNRLFIDESTAKGFNLWYDIWQEAKKDHHCICIFAGWWSHPDQRIDQHEPDFQHYGVEPPTAEERAKIRTVFEQYGHEVSVEQLAWIRREMNPTSDEEAAEDPSRLEQQPWTEQEAFQLTGSIFFDPGKLTDQASKNVSRKYKTYTYFAGIEFTDFMVRPALNLKSVHLKVWEEPIEESVYIVAADVAFGHSEKNDRSAVQVLRCYADGIDQVAEYAWPLIDTRQFAWVIASLEGWYSGEKSIVYRIVEINGPGEATWRELISLKQQLAHGYFGAQLAERGLQNIQRNVRNYLYQRSDSQHPGQAYQWKCLALDTRIPTPTGWTTMGMLRDGDKVFDENGSVCNVVAAHPAVAGKPCFRVAFEGGSSIVADEGHVWAVRSPSKVAGGPLEYRKTSELIAGLHKISVAMPLRLPDAALPVDPYTLGVWLGDGDSDSGQFCCHERDLGEFRENLAGVGETLALSRRDPRNSTCYQRVIGLRTKLGEVGVLNDKHIPVSYLRGSYEQRIALLQGLMDTDGTICAYNGRQCSFTTTSLPLATGFVELLRSLGVKPKFCIRVRSLAYKGKKVECAPAFQFAFTSRPDIPFFRLRRKLARQAWVGRLRLGRSGMQNILSVEPVLSVPVRCIEVDSPSHLYLAGEGMIPTHNTQTQLKVAILERLRDFTNNGMLRIRSLDTLEEMRTITREGDEIGAQGQAKDDRVMSLAMGVRCWDERARRSLVTARRTRDAEEAKRRVSIRDQVQMYNQNQFEVFLAGKGRARRLQAQAANRKSWRG